jgi:hypothetical protein
LEEKIDELIGKFYGTNSPINEQGAIFGVLVETLRQQVKTNELLKHQNKMSEERNVVLEKQSGKLTRQNEMLGRILMKGK